MIIMDFSQIFLSNLFVAAGNHADNIEIDLLRHMVLKSIQKYNKTFRAEYGQLVIACDGRKYWRKDEFPYYKSNRKEDRKKSIHDWNKIYEKEDAIIEEIKENFPYPVIQLDKLEADDIIGILCEEYAPSEKVLILSKDHDFVQLQKYQNVKQFTPTGKKYITTNNAIRDLYSHIICGDKGDGIPNIKSDDDTYASDKRAKPIYNEKKLNELLDTEELYHNPEQLFNTKEMINFDRNRMLIDLEMIPEKYKNMVLQEYNQQKDSKDKSKILKYMQKHRLKKLLATINDF